MRILHTADLHLGHLFHQYPRLREHRHFLDWLHRQITEEEIDALIVSGDVFDSYNPGAEAQRLLYDFLLRVVDDHPGLQIVLIAGNHDSGARLDAVAGLLSRHNIYVRGTLPRNADGDPDFEQLLLPLAPRGQEEAALVCWAVPYLRPGDYATELSAEEGLKSVLTALERLHRESDFRRCPTLLAAHFYAAHVQLAEREHSERIVVGGQDQVDVKVLGQKHAYVALGHIHRAQSVGDRTTVRYAGSALPMSFGERDYHHGAVLVDIDAKGNSQFRILDYTPLCPLMTIPVHAPGDPEAVLRLLAELPEAAAGAERDAFPYLEVNLRIRQPEPDLRHRILDALRNKAVRLCRITTGTSRPTPQADELPTFEGELQNLQPLDVAQRFFQKRFGESMPKPLTERFLAACQKAETDHSCSEPS